jgi:hypothetical protein
MTAMTAMTTKADYTGHKLSGIKTALAVGCLSGVSHLLWSLVVAIGVAQTLLDWVYQVHFLNNPFHVADFNPATAALLVSITFVVGCVIGWFFAFLWNLLHRPDKLKELAA